MPQWSRLLLRTFKVFLLFTGCTILFYYALIWFNEEYQEFHQYDEPSGSAIKVNGNLSADEYTWKERIFLFYLDGE